MAFETGENTRRRRRSWYRRQLRIQRGLIAGALVLAFAALGWNAVTGLLALRARRTAANAATTQTGVRVHKNSLPPVGPAVARISSSENDVYPYSVIPGGVRDAVDLERAARHDRLVWEHYARFQYQHARLVRATDAHAVFLSYRLRNHIYWTRKRMHLHPGELLITDGKITARTRCGNQVSEEPKPEVSEEEPSEDVLDRSVAAVVPSLPIRSALTSFSLPGADPVAPQGPRLFSGGFLFPLVPFGVPLGGVCETPAQEAFEQSHGIADNEANEKHCKTHRPALAVPEPSTMLLISSGLVAVYGQYRRNARARSQL